MLPAPLWLPRPVADGGASLWRTGSPQLALPQPTCSFRCPEPLWSLGPTIARRGQGTERGWLS